MESPDTIQRKDNTSSAETVKDNYHADDGISPEGPHKCDDHETTLLEEGPQRGVVHRNYVLSTTETGKSSCKGLDELSAEEEDWKSWIQRGKKDGTNFQTWEATSSQVSFGERFHEGKQTENCYESDTEKCKEKCAEEKNVLEMSCVDEINNSKENIPDEINVKCTQESSGLKHNKNEGGLRKREEVPAMKTKENASVVILNEESVEMGNSRSRGKTMSATLKEPCEREKGDDGDSFQEDAVRFGERMRSSTRSKKNASTTWHEGLRLFRQCLKNAEFLSCISPSEFCLPMEIRLHRHRSIVKPLHSSKTQAENRKSVNVKPFKNIRTPENPASLQPPRNAKSIRRAKEILFKRKTTDSAVRRSVRQKMAALRVKKRLKNEMRGLYATGQRPSHNLRSNGQKSLIEKEKPANARECRGSDVDFRKKDAGLPERDDHDKYKNLSPTSLAHLRKLWQIRHKPKQKSKFTHKKREYKSIRQVHQREGYVRRFKFVGQLDSRNRSEEEENVKTNLREILVKGKVGLTPVPSNDSWCVEPFQPSLTSSQMFREQKRKPTQHNFNGKRASIVPHAGGKFLRQDPEYIPQSCDTSDSEIPDSDSTASAAPSPNSSRVGSPEIEIDVDLSQVSETVQQDEVISEAAEDRDGPPIPPVENENVQPRKLPIFRKLPNPSSEPVAVFYYNPEATMLRRCSKYHSCCQQSATAAAVTKTDSSSQWEDPTVLYELLKLKTLPGLQHQLRDLGVKYPTYSIVKKKHGKYEIKSRSNDRLPNFSAILTPSQDQKKKKRGGNLHKTLPSGKSVMSNSNPKFQGSSECASIVMPNPETVSFPMATSMSIPLYQHRVSVDNIARETGKHQSVHGCTIPCPSAASTSGQQRTQYTSASDLKSQTQTCTSSVSNTASDIQVVNQANLAAGIPVVMNNTGIPLCSFSILSDTNMSRPDSTASALGSSASVKPAAVGGAHPVAVPVVTPGVHMYGSLPLVNEGDGKSRFLFKDGILWQKVLKDDMFVWSKVDEGKYNIVNVSQS